MDYARLCYLLKQSRFEAMARSYGDTDADNSIFTVRSGASSHEVRAFGDDMPIELWAIRQAIEAVMENIRWTRP